MDFCTGNAFKYIFRRDFKDNKERDLLKSHFFIKKAIEIKSDSYQTFSSELWDLIDKVRKSEENPFGEILYSLWVANGSPKGYLHLEHAKRMLEDVLKDYGLL